MYADDIYVAFDAGSAGKVIEYGGGIFVQPSAERPGAIFQERIHRGLSTQDKNPDVKDALYI